ncbi:MFS transporter [Clostridium sp. ZS2-4]|uniref:MFS transporter n=1 Tax=Clostridium sp. ZS2-4 TaxID=2987703 RepID=UPI00227D3868|nr:MFS transporter [Clostridium sp. ZS2-4]MCY6354256.1 MFS transporter [Clostridium sp. ZS2-4]
MQNLNLRRKSKRQNKLICNMLLLLFGRLVSLFGSYIYNFAISLYVLKTTGSGTTFATAMVFGTVPRIIFGPIAGVIADKLDRKKMVVVMDILSGIIVISLFTAAAVDTLRLPYIYAASFLLSTCSTFFDIPFRASIPNIVDDKNLMRINSLSDAISSIAQIGGPFLGGLVFSLIDIKLFLLVNSISFIISGITEVFIDFNFNKPKQEKEKNNDMENETTNLIRGSFFSQFNEGLRFLKFKKALFILSMFLVILNFLFVLGSIVPYSYILVKVVGVSESQFGILEAIFPVGMLLGAAILSILPEREKKFKTLIFSLLITEICILFIGIPIIPNLMVFNTLTYFIFYMIDFFILGIAIAIVNIPLTVMIQRETPDDLRGRIQSLIETISGILTPFAMILSGVLLDLLPSYILPISAGVVLLIFTLYMGFNKDIRNI